MAGTRHTAHGCCSATAASTPARLSQRAHALAHRGIALACVLPPRLACWRLGAPARSRPGSAEPPGMPPEHTPLLVCTRRRRQIIPSRTLLAGDAPLLSVTRIVHALQMLPSSSVQFRAGDAHMVHGRRPHQPAWTLARRISWSSSSHH